MKNMPEDKRTVLGCGKHIGRWSICKRGAWIQVIAKYRHLERGVPDEWGHSGYCKG